VLSSLVPPFLEAYIEIIDKDNDGGGAHNEGVIKLGWTMQMSLMVSSYVTNFCVMT
jgi:hypothetical protein